MSHSRSQSDWSELIRRCVDGSPTPDDIAALRAALHESEDARALYVDYLRLHAMLEFPRVDSAAPSASTSHTTKPRGAAQQTPGVFRLTPITLGAAAALLLTAAAVAVYVFAFSTNPQSQTPNPSAPPIATLIDSDTTVIVGDDLAHPGADYTAGDYSIESGTADFLLTNRVSVRLTGRTSLTLHSNMAATMSHGTAVFNCPPGAGGYTVHLPDGSRVVDLGTRFRVAVDNNGVADVHVLEGRVRLFAGDDANGRPNAVEDCAVDQQAWVYPATTLAPARVAVNLVRNGEFHFDTDGGPHDNYAGRATTDITAVRHWHAGPAAQFFVSEPQSIFDFDSEYLQVQTLTTTALHQTMTVNSGGPATLSMEVAHRNDGINTKGHVFLELYEGEPTSFDEAAAIVPDSTHAPTLSKSIATVVQRYGSLKPGVYTVRIGGERHAGILFQAGIDRVRLVMEAAATKTPNTADPRSLQPQPTVPSVADTGDPLRSDGHEGGASAPEEIR